MINQDLEKENLKEIYENHPIIFLKHLLSLDLEEKDKEQEEEIKNEPL